MKRKQPIKTFMMISIEKNILFSMVYMKYFSALRVYVRPMAIAIKGLIVLNSGIPLIYD